MPSHRRVRHFAARLSARGHRVREFEHRVAIARMRSNGSHLRVGIRRPRSTARAGAGGPGDRCYGESWYAVIRAD